MTIIINDGKKIKLNSNGTWKEIKESTIDTSSSTQFDVRKCAWGMNQAQVKATETLDIIVDDENTVAYKGSLNNHSCLIVYRFLNKEFSSLEYMFQHTHSDDARFINDFDTLKSSLTKKYGPPSKDDRFFHSDTYEDTPGDWGMTLSTGELSFFTDWIVNKTKISLCLFGDNYEVSFVLAYTGLEYEESIEATNEQKLLDEL